MEDKIWFAGFYEGEGSISNDISNNMRLRVNISQNDKTPLELGQQIWGGSVRKRIRKSPASDKICTGYEWTMYHKEASQFINDIEPYMKIPYKINQIKIAREKHQKGIVRRFKCHKCDLDYANPSARRRHEKSKHTETQALVGEEDKGFTFGQSSCDTVELREYP